MSRIVPFLFLFACSPYRTLRLNHEHLSESPCIDGTILNIDQAGCESFYWGAPDGIILKIRCAYSPDKSFWTNRDFYAVLHNNDSVNAVWGTYCEDQFVRMYAIPTGEKLSK